MPEKVSGGGVESLILPKAVVLAGVLFVSLTSILIRLSQAPPFIMLFYRQLFSLAILAPLVYRRRRVLAELQPRDGLRLAGVGAVFALHILSWILAVRNTTIASAVVISNCHPVFVVFLSYLLWKKRYHRRALFGIALALAGCVIISAADLTAGGSALTGDIAAVGTALFMALYFIFGTVFRARIPAMVYIFLVNGASLIFITAAVLASGTRFGPYPLREWLCFLSLAVLCTLLGHGLINWSLKHVDPSFVSTSFLIEPVYASVIAFFLFAEIPSRFQLCGALVIIGGLFFYNRYENRPVPVRGR